MARVPLPGRQGPLPEIQGLQQVSNPLPEIPGLQQVSNLQLDNNPRNRIVPPITIPGRDRQVQATRTGITTPGARGRQGRSSTSRAGHSISRAGHLHNLPVRLRHPGRVAVVPQGGAGGDSSVRIIRDLRALALKALNHIFQFACF